MTAPRPLPPTPSLEFARKEAKELLRQLRAADAQALQRARDADATQRSSPPDNFRLTDAQLTLAREYGFVSWPRLVRYFTTAERQRHRRHSTLASPSAYEQLARSLLADHAKRRLRAGKILAEYTPRFFGAPLDQVFRATVTEDEARHALARAIGCASWPALIAKAEAAIEVRNDGWDRDVDQILIGALHRADVSALQAITAEHPALLRPSERETARNGGITNFALGAERNLGVEAMRPVMAWLKSHGLDVDATRSAQLCGSIFMTIDDVRSLLDRGANPNWIAPNGISVLEHALLRYQNGECVDLIARHVAPKRALWIAAGLGDLTTVSTFFDARGKLTAEARAHRPDFTAVGPISWPSQADADDETILFEAAFVAASNGRVAVLDDLIARGFPVNSVAWDYPLLSMAADSGWLAAAECLTAHGADPRLTSRSGIPSAHDLARERFSRQPWDLRCRQLAVSCTVDVASVETARVQRTPPTLDGSQELERILQFASDDARRQGVKEVSMEHMLFGMLRVGGMTQYMLTRGPRLDLEQFRNAALDRVRVTEPSTDAGLLPLTAEVTTAVGDAVALAARRHDDAAHGMHLLAVLVQQEASLATFLTPYGGSVGHLRAPLESVMQYDNAV